MSIGIILLVILIFGFLVFIHELGHFVAARRNGVEVYEFGFGFPPKMFGKKFGGTEYSINWLPLGGFVRLKGENLTDQSAGSFGAASFWAKTKILFAGVAMNALAAYLIIVALCLTGLPPMYEGQYSYGQAVESQPRQVMAAVVGPGSPAETAGIRQGDIILSVDGRKLGSERDLMESTKENAGRQVRVEVQRDGKPSSALVQLKGPENKSGFLGVTPLQTYKLQYGFLDSLVTAAGITGQMMWMTIAAFGNLIAGLFTQGKVSEQVAGPVGIVVILGNIVQLGAAYLLTFIASISVSLAVINALPLPALDGGRWALALAQRVTGRKLSQDMEGAVHAAGFLALIALMVVVTIVDIKRFG